MWSFVAIVCLICFAESLSAPKNSSATQSINKNDCSSAEAFHETTQKCYNVSTLASQVRGPCPEKKVYNRQDEGDGKLGGCVCSRPRQKCSPPVVLYSRDDTCYEMFTYPYACPDDEWLVIGKDTRPVCLKISCDDTPLPITVFEVEPRYQGEVYQFVHNGKCYVTETQAFCPEGMVARYVYPSVIPACYKPDEKTCGDF